MPLSFMFKDKCLINDNRRFTKQYDYYKTLFRNNKWAYKEQAMKRMDDLSDDFLKFCSRVHGVGGDFGETSKSKESTEIRRLYLREKPPPMYFDSAEKVTIKAKEQKKKRKKGKQKRKKGKQKTKKNTQKLKKEVVNASSSKEHESQSKVEKTINTEQSEPRCSFIHESTADIFQVEFDNENAKDKKASAQENSLENNEIVSNLEGQLSRLDFFYTKIEDNFKLTDASAENQKAENDDAVSDFERPVLSYAAVLKSNHQMKNKKSMESLLIPTTYKKIGKWKKENIIHKFTMSHL